MSQSQISVCVNFAVATLFCAAVGLMPLLLLTSGESLSARTVEMGAVLSEALRTMPGATTSTIVIPLLAAFVCGAGFIVAVVRAAPQSRYRATLVSIVIVAALSLVATIQLRGVPILAITLVPLCFAAYSAYRTVQVNMSSRRPAT